MPGMKGSETYNKMCGSDPLKSVIAQCKTLNFVLPTSKQATQQIYSICSEMSMNGCEKCKFSFIVGKITRPDATYSNCDLLTVYSNLCIEMPDMYQCKVVIIITTKEWKNYCSGGLAKTSFCERTSIFSSV